QGVNPALMYGGSVGSIVLAPNDAAAEKAGIPKNVYSVYGIFSLDDVVAGWMNGALNGITGSVGVTHVDSAWSGFSKVVKLPAYTLLNAGFHYENVHWKFGLEGKNLTNERLFPPPLPPFFSLLLLCPAGARSA